MHFKRFVRESNKVFHFLSQAEIGNKIRKKENYEKNNKFKRWLRLDQVQIIIINGNQQYFFFILRK